MLAAFETIILERDMMAVAWQWHGTEPSFQAIDRQVSVYRRGAKLLIG